MTEKIILIDDDNNILTSVSVALKAEGWVVETYNDSEQGLIALQRDTPDIAILDIKMPKLDGMEVLKFKTKAEAKKFLADEFHLTDSEIFVNGLEVVYLQ